MVSTLKNDNPDIRVDHEDVLNRFSAPLRPVSTQDSSEERQPISLSRRAKELLRICIEEIVEQLNQASKSDVDAARELRHFLGSAGVMRAKIWKRVYRASRGPPRGALARWARRLGGGIHDELGFWNYATLEEFRSECKRVASWYKRGRKLYRPSRGIKRTRADLEEHRGKPRRRVAMSKKLSAHYMRLKRKLREEGLWNWRRVALALHEAGLAIHSGTVCVERVWAVLKEFLPDNANRMSPLWFRFLADMMFLRYTYLHFNHNALPAWTRADALMTAQVDTLLTIAREMQESEEYSTPLVLRALEEAYAQGGPFREEEQPSLFQELAQVSQEEFGGVNINPYMLPSKNDEIEPPRPLVTDCEQSERNHFEIGVCNGVFRNRSCFFQDARLESEGRSEGMSSP